LSFVLGRVPRLAFAAVVLPILAATNDGLAQSAPELERGRNLFHQALSMEVAGDWAGALSALEQVSRIRTTLQVRFHLARCKEHLGRMTEALGDYRLAEYEATRVNATELTDIEQARKVLEAQVPKLVVTLNSKLAYSTVELDGIALGDSRIGKQTMVNAGEHQLLVRANDGRSFVRRVRVRASTTEKVQLDAPEGFVSVTQQTRENQYPGAQTPATDAKADGHTATWAWIAGGMGVASVIGAAALWYVRERAIDDLNNGCGAGNVCPMNLKSTQTRGEQVSVAAPIALGVGLLGLGIAAYGMFAPEHRSIAVDSRASSAFRLSFDCDARFAGVDVAGAF